MLPHQARDLLDLGGGPGRRGVEARGQLPQRQLAFADRLPEILSAGTAIVLVEQDIALAAASADRIYCLLEGRITLTGKASEISREEIAAAYFGVHK